MKTSFTSRSDFYSAPLLLAFVLCLCGVLLASAEWTKACAQISSTAAPIPPDRKAAIFPPEGTHANTNLTYKVIAATQDTWGYDVFADGRLMIHQTSVPAPPGNEGFKTKDDATKVALLVIEEIRKGKMPPTISIHELTTLNGIK